MCVPYCRTADSVRFIQAHAICTEVLSASCKHKNTIFIVMQCKNQHASLLDEFG